MSLIPCPECEAEVSTNAAACPKCGNPLAFKTAEPLKKMPSRLFEVVRGAVIILLAFIAIHFYVEYAGKQTTTSVEREPAARPAVTVTAVRLLHDYQENEVAADDYYKGRGVSVDGIVQGIKKDFRDNTFIQLRTAERFSPVHAYIKASQGKVAADLERGDKVHVDCTGAGMIVGSPILNNCDVSR
jgi:hypothetical protein